MTDPIKSDHATLLNTLHSMSTSYAYAVRWPALKEAEAVILGQEQKINDLKACLNALLDSGTVYYSAIELNVHKGFDAEVWEEQAMALLGRTEKGANA